MPKTRSSSKKIESIQTKTAEYLKSKDLTFAQLQCFAEKLNMKKIKKHYKKEIYITKIVSASALGSVPKIENLKISMSDIDDLSSLPQKTSFQLT